MKSTIRQEHLGLENLKKCACQTLLWSLINIEIEHMIKNCPTCLTFHNQQNNELGIRHPVLPKPQTKLSADLFRLYAHYYLLVVDYNSKFSAVKNLKNSQFLTVINKCKKIISQYGIRKELITDNGPEFTSRHFKKFSKSWGFKHKQLVPIITNPTVQLNDQSKQLNELCKRQNMISQTNT